LEHTIGVFVAPPGVGKTVVGAYLVAARARSTLVLVHRQPLLDQWIAQLAMFLGMDSKAIGQIGAGKRVPARRLDVAMLQSLVREGQVDDVVATYRHVIVDECGKWVPMGNKAAVNRLDDQHGSKVVAKSASGTPDVLEVPDSIGGPWRTRTSDPDETGLGLLKQLPIDTGFPKLRS